MENTENSVRLKKLAAIRKMRANMHPPVLGFLTSLSDQVPKRRCDPEALYFKEDFQTRKNELCRKLFKLYNSAVFENKLPEDLEITWSIKIIKGAALTFNLKKSLTPEIKVRGSRIVMATKVCDRPARVRDTLIHEMCHAASWIFNERKSGHGPHWKAWVQVARNALKELPPITRCHQYKIYTRYTYKCVGCGYSIGRHSKSLNVVIKRCGHCYGEFELIENIQTTAQKTSKKRRTV